MLNYRTAGESHGKALVTIVEGLPARVPVPESAVADMLSRRRRAGGRSRRMSMEDDSFEILSGVRRGLTTGSPVAIIIRNRDNRSSLGPLHVPRPGHADLAGMLKYGTDDARDVAERASARETAARCAAGALAACLLAEMDMHVFGHVVAIGRVRQSRRRLTLEQALRLRSLSRFCTVRPEADGAVAKAIARAAARGDTLGGVFEVKAVGLPPGLGGCMTASGRLDARLAAALMAIPSVKGVEVGGGFALAALPGSRVHDEIVLSDEGGVARSTNRSGGIEGGMTNGEMLVVRAAVKPVPTLGKPLRSVDMRTMKPSRAPVERADVCAAPAASVVGEAAVAFELARAARERFGGDTLKQMQAAMRRSGGP
ncbi:MAG: chorismate synthase [Planctomycetota bacterium]|nr:MAG: chorismate synthase [Planctomycetota bacterium]